MRTVTDENKNGDVPTSEKLGLEFDKFLETDFAKLLLDDKVIKDGDGSDWIRFILTNRMRRAFEAGFKVGESEFQLVDQLFVKK